MATTQQSTVVGVFEDRAMAEQAVAELRQAGFNDNQISFSGHGASTGGILAGLKSLFSKQATAEDHVFDDLVGMGMPQEDATYYQQEYEAGRSIVAVTGGSRMPEAATILARYGAYGANRRSAQTADYGTAASTAAQQTAADTEGERHVQLREEQLQVYTQPVQVGEVGLRKEVVTEQRTLNVPVSHEEVYVDRHPVSGQVSDTPIGEDETIRVPVGEEQVNVSKQTVETGEVAVGKRQVQDTQQVRDTVRQEKARIERKGDVPIHDTKTDPFHPSQKDVEDLLEDH